MRSYINQYFNDQKALINSKGVKNKLRLFLIYNRLCIKNILFTKIFKIKTNNEKFLGFKVYYDNFNSFFAMFTEIFMYNIYHFRSNKNSPLLLDCGSNIGLAAIYFKYLIPNSKINCFEPDLNTFNILKKNIEVNNFKGVTLHNVALGNKNGKQKFYSFADFQGGPGNTLDIDKVDFKNINEFQVDVIKLSSLNFKDVDYLKIDVEGSEGEMFKDFKETKFLDEVDLINLEYHYNPKNNKNNLSGILSLLEENNFNYIINPDQLIEDKITIDNFRIRKNNYVTIINCFR